MHNNTTGNNTSKTIYNNAKKTSEILRYKSNKTRTSSTRGRRKTLMKTYTNAVHARGDEDSAP